LFKFAWNCLRSVYLYYKVKPDVVITTGTHTAVPMCRIAHAHHKKVIWIETFANSKTPTMAGKMIYPIADLFVVQWESMLEVYPKAVYGGWIF
jgi:UDP-N-acetylglucosamine:LPS N-acetylglucosamine transferase